MTSLLISLYIGVTLVYEGQSLAQAHWGLGQYHQKILIFYPAKLG